RRRTGASRPGVAQDRGLDGAHGVSECTERPSLVPSSWTTCDSAWPREIRLDGIFGNHSSEDTPLRRSLPRAQGDERIEYHPVDLQARPECALARAKCPLGRNADVIDAGLPWRRLDALDQSRWRNSNLWDEAAGARDEDLHFGFAVRASSHQSNSIRPRATEPDTSRRKPSFISSNL